MKATALVFLVTIAIACAQPQAVAPDVAKRYARQLDHIERYCRQRGCFSDEHFWRESARVARRLPADVNHAIMLRSRKWDGEDGLMYVPLVAFLPRTATMQLLREYEHSRRERERIWAREFIIELEEPGTRKAIRALSGSRE